MADFIVTAQDKGDPTVTYQCKDCLRPMFTLGRAVDAPDVDAYLYVSDTEHFSIYALCGDCISRSKGAEAQGGVDGHV